MPSFELQAGLEPRKGPSVYLRCFGTFVFQLGENVIVESKVKPRERTLLHLLAMNAGRSVHRETLLAALWPDVELPVGLHRLQVAVSSLRRLLGRSVEGREGFVLREDEAYRLVLPDDADVDLWRFNRGLRRASLARSERRADHEEEALLGALDGYGGPLLSVDGPAEWVVEERASLQAKAVDASIRLATMRFDGGRYSECAAAARSGIGIDRYRDELWEVLIDSTHRLGHKAAEDHARRGYEAVLVELGT
jgi:DNA-binding SARP family transcriptional activator